MKPVHVKILTEKRDEIILTDEALVFVETLEREFASKRKMLLKKRRQRQVQIDSGIFPDFLDETEHIRSDASWRIAETPPDLQKRVVEITGPVDRKMVINALNSGADVFMADFEDANSPTWDNVVEGQRNLFDAIRQTISFTNESGKEYSLNEKTATLLVRPRGWHLDERHVLVDSKPISASLFDFGLYFFHNAKALLGRGSGPYFYLPKLENHLEAQLWNDVFCMAQEMLDIPRGTIRATVLIETILAAFEMEEILYELCDHSAGLNAGRWDYIFSIIKTFRNQSDFTMPDRAQVTMAVPFMHAYSELLVKTCHKRGAHAIGGMAAFIPSKDRAANEIAIKKVYEDKTREANAGFDGTWVAHPGLVAVAREAFSEVLSDRPHQKNIMRNEVSVTADDLLNFKIPDGTITEQGLRTNINVGILYIESWLHGTGAAALYNLMEDAATAEISRAQIWQWLHSQAKLEDGRLISYNLYEQLLLEEINKIKSAIGPQKFESGKFHLAQKIFDSLVTNDMFEDFLTLQAYMHLD